MTVLEDRLADYLALRRRLGHKLAKTERQLNRFVGYLDHVGADTVTMETALAFVLDPGLDPASSIPANVWRQCAASLVILRASTRPRRSRRLGSCPTERAGAAPTCSATTRSRC